MDEEDGGLTARVIGAGIAVHRELGPGLLESVYEECLCYELQRSGIAFARQVPVAVRYRDNELEAAFRLDVLVEGVLVVEIKAAERNLPLQTAQVLTYMRLGGFRVGLLMNFNSVKLTDGVRRFAL